MVLPAGGWPAMHRRELLSCGAIAEVPAIPDGSLAASVEYGLRADGGFELRLWMDFELAPPYVKAGEFWTEWTIGQPCWVRFVHAFTALGRAAFAAVEVLPARDPTQRPQALWLLASTPPALPSAASP